MPRVSVCIPAYNAARYLREAIRSVLSQDYTDYELIVCDDASTDETALVCAQYRDEGVRHLRFDARGGQAGNFNRCLDAARGEFVTLLHADDLFLPGFLADRVARLSSDPRAIFAFGAVRVIDSDSKTISNDVRWPEDQSLDRKSLLEALLFGSVVYPPSLLVRRSAVEKAGPFRADLTWGHDWEWMLRLAELGGAAYCASPLAAYRVHDASGTAEILNSARNGHQERRILRDAFASVAKVEPSLWRLRGAAFRALGLRHMYFSGQALLSGRQAVARYNLRYAALANPAMLLRPSFWVLVVASLLGRPSWYEKFRVLRGQATATQGAAPPHRPAP